MWCFLSISQKSRPFVDVVQLQAPLDVSLHEDGLMLGIIIPIIMLPSDR